MSIDIGTSAPALSLQDQDGKTRKLSEFKGKWVLLYFYPKDNTPGCTKEACSIRDVWGEFKKAGIVVLGVSKDSVESHRKFAEKHELPFTLLADPEGKAIEKYGAWKKKSMFGKTFMGIQRMSYLIDPKGNVAKVYLHVKPELHADEVLADVKTLA